METLGTVEKALDVLFHLHGAGRPQGVTDVGRALGMPKGRFAITIAPEPDAAPARDGNDNIAFEVAINPGQPMLPLAKVASGGELSRISLAIQVIELALLHHPRLTFRRFINRRRGRKNQPQQVGAIQLPLPQAHTNAIRGMDRRRIPVIHPHRQ